MWNDFQGKEVAPVGRACVWEGRKPLDKGIGFGMEWERLFIGGLFWGWEGQEVRTRGRMIFFLGLLL